VGAAALDAEAHAVLHRPELAENLRRLILLLERGAIAVRSAPFAGGGAPDFSVFGGETGPFALLVGPHRFGVAAFGEPMLASVHGRDGAAQALLRFEEVWGRAYDIGAPVAGILIRAERGGRARSEARPQSRPEGQSSRETRASTNAGAPGIG